MLKVDFRHYMFAGVARITLLITGKDGFAPQSMVIAMTTAIMSARFTGYYYPGFFGWVYFLRYKIRGFSS